MNTRVYGSERYNNLIAYTIGGHADTIVGAFFEKNSLGVSF
jgi:periodic tryptophan protein 2